MRSTEAFQLSSEDLPVRPHKRAEGYERGITMRKLISIQELSQLWSVPVPTLYNWVNQRRVPYVKLGRCLRFDPAELEEFRRRHSIMETAGKR